MEGKEVVGLFDLRGSMALKGQTGIGRRHATAIIYHLNGRTTGIHHNYVDGLCPGIHGILDQLLDDRSRALDDFTSGDLVRDGVGQKADEIHDLMNN